MLISHAVVHYIQKERGRTAQVKLREEPLPPSERLTQLVESLRKLYNEKTGHGTGIFQNEVSTHPLSSYLSKENTKEWNFLEFSTKAMRLLEQRINQASAATGSYTLFVQYSENNIRFLIIAVLKQKPGLGFNQKLDLSAIEHIDLDTLHEMARINLTVWKDGGDRYLSFAKKRSLDDFSKYFREFIGCDEFSESTTLTKALVYAVNQYCKEKALSDEQATRQKTITFQYCEEKTNASDVISLAALSARLNEEEPEEFLKFINERELELHIADGFEPDKKVYKKLKKIQYKEKGISLVFDTDLLNTKISVNKEDSTIIIRNISKEFLADLSNV